MNRVNGKLVADEPRVSPPIKPNVVESVVSIWRQFAPTVPVLPTQPAREYCAVYILRFELFHGMEEVVGSIPTRSTSKPLTNQ